MAVYKVIQDIEAEDKLIGFLTLRGFIYAATAVLIGFINFRLMVSPVFGPAKWIIIFIFFWPMVLFGILASPLGRDQPTEVWLLARIRFMLKPRERLWNQLGIRQLVIVTAAPQKNLHLVKDLSQTEVKSRLQALSQTLDSRGWSIKNISVNLPTVPAFLQPQHPDSDRLVGQAAAQPAQVQAVDVHPADDILDEQNNPTAQKFDSMMQEAQEARRIEMQQKLVEARVAAKVAAADQKSSAPVTDDPATQKMLDSMHQRAKFYAAGADAVTSKSQTVKLELANAGNALSIASVAKLVNQASDGEVVVPIH